MYNGYKNDFGITSPWNPTGNTLPNGIARTMPLGVPQQPEGMSALQQALLAFRQMATQPVNPNQTPLAPQTGFPDLEQVFQRFTQVLNQFRGATGNQPHALGQTQVGQMFFNNLLGNQNPGQMQPAVIQAPPKGNPPSPIGKNPLLSNKLGPVMARGQTENASYKGGDASSLFSGTTIPY